MSVRSWRRWPSSQARIRGIQHAVRKDVQDRSGLAWHGHGTLLAHLWSFLPGSTRKIAKATFEQVDQHSLKWYASLGDVYHATTTKGDLLYIPAGWFVSKWVHASFHASIKMASTLRTAILTIQIQKH
eukprot:1580406-Amphidinium_carterae.1